MAGPADRAARGAADAAPRPLLLTGFEPFGGERRNPSIELARALEGECLHGLPIVVQALPCVFETATQALDAALDRWAPAVVLALGQAGGRCDLSFERVAINLIDARIPDNAGAQPIDVAVQPGGPAAYFTSLPVKAMVAAARAAGVPASLSTSAGTFVCNQVFYALMHRLATTPRVPGVGAGFLHLPLLPQQAGAAVGQPSMALDTMVRGLRAALAEAVRRLQGDLGDLASVEGRLH